MPKPLFDQAAFDAEVSAIRAELVARGSSAPATSTAAFDVKAPMSPRKGRVVLNFVAATGRAMPGMLGEVELAISREAIDLERLEAGLLALVDGHQTDRLLGRVTGARITNGKLIMQAEAGTTTRARRAVQEIGDGSRGGYSPGFLVGDVAVLDEDDNGGYRWRITQWSPYEVSSTSIPRNPEATHLNTMKASMEASMNQTDYGALADSHMAAPRIVSFDDGPALALALTDKALDNPNTSLRSRHRLQIFRAEVDRALADGATQEEAVTQARDTLRGVMGQGHA